MVIIGKGSGFEIKIDDTDLNIVSKYTWYARSFANNRKKYAVASGGVLMHRLILGLTDSNIYVDHINHDGLDNRRVNLRIANRNQNASNRRSSIKGASKYLGVCPKREKWRAQITSNRKTFYIGTFNTELDAAIAYNKKAIEMHGEFANLNHI